MVHSVVLLFLIVASVCEPAMAQDQTGETRPLVRLVMGERPSLRFGDFLRVDLRAKAQLDFRSLSPGYETSAGALDLNRIRFGVEGEFFEHFEYQVEREFRATFGGRPIRHPLRDAYVNFKYFDDLQIQAGKFKIPISLEELTGVSNLDFINRSRLADNLAPARDIGAMLHGSMFDQGFAYQVGIFQTDGENSESNTDVRGSSMFATRITGRPLRLFDMPGDWDDMQIGFEVGASEVPEGLNGLEGRTVNGEVFFPHVFVKGGRLRLGTEASWRPGPFSVQAEYIHVREDRDGQSVRGEDLPARISTAWYLTGTWALTGESKENGIEPRRPFPFEGMGAFELAARYEEISFRSGGGGGLEFSSPRAANLVGNSDRVWTWGLNWYFNRFGKVQVNAVQETIEDHQRSPVEGRDRFWSGIVRLQFSM